MTAKQQATVSLKLSELSLDELVQVTQGLGHDIERLRQQRAHIRILIDAKLLEQRWKPGPGDAHAEGATLKTGTKPRPH
jgi:hypothetical protein